MNRKEFLATLGIAAAGITLFSELESCKKPSNSVTNVDFTIDLTQAQYSSLKTIGGSAINQNVIIVRTGTTTFNAVSSLCTHAGCPVQYESTKNDFFCPCHGSVFDASGGVVSGPAPTALQKYNTTLTGNSLRVYS